ncbi:hypothetical protein Pelo_12483 [Pelomyxa schiedti]|nr:hypothetical protein Pelo_12483 [Pelomyxa schiedti]
MERERERERERDSKGNSNSNINISNINSSSIHSILLGDTSSPAHSPRHHSRSQSHAQTVAATATATTHAAPPATVSPIATSILATGSASGSVTAAHIISQEGSVAQTSSPSLPQTPLDVRHGRKAHTSGHHHASSKHHAYHSASPPRQSSASLSRASQQPFSLSVGVIPSYTPPPLPSSATSSTGVTTSAIRLPIVSGNTSTLPTQHVTSPRMLLSPSAQNCSQTHGPATPSPPLPSSPPPYLLPFAASLSSPAIKSPTITTPPPYLCADSSQLLRSSSFPDFMEFVEDTKYHLPKHISMDSPGALSIVQRSTPPPSPQLVDSLQTALMSWGTSTDSIRDLLKIVMRHVNTVRGSQGLPVLVASLRPQPRQTQEIHHSAPMSHDARRTESSPLRESKLPPQQVEELLDLVLEEMESDS